MRDILKITGSVVEICHVLRELGGGEVVRDGGKFSSVCDKHMDCRVQIFLANIQKINK